LLFIIHTNDLPPTKNTLTEPIIFADDTSVIICNKNFDDFCATSNLVLSHMSKWFTDNKLVPNIDKTNVIKFITTRHNMLKILVIMESFFKSQKYEIPGFEN
jgi:cellulose biosynthesis protein BcsQ